MLVASARFKGAGGGAMAQRQRHGVTLAPVVEVAAVPAAEPLNPAVAGGDDEDAVAGGEDEDAASEATLRSASTVVGDSTHSGDESEGAGAAPEAAVAADCPAAPRDTVHRRTGMSLDEPLQQGAMTACGGSCKPPRKCHTGSHST